MNKLSKGLLFGLVLSVLLNMAVIARNVQLNRINKEAYIAADYAMSIALYYKRSLQAVLESKCPSLKCEK
jgi:hypothetical protein